MSFLIELADHLATGGIGTVGLDTDTGWGIFVARRPGNMNKVIVLTPTPTAGEREIPTTNKAFQVIASSEDTSESEGKVGDIRTLLHAQNGIQLATILVFNIVDISSAPYLLGVDEKNRVQWGMNFMAFVRGAII